MNPDTDTDLSALREFRATLDEPREGGLARSRWRLAHTDSPQRPRRPRSWVLATAGSALAVAVVVGGAATLHQAGPRQGQQAPGQPSARPSASATATATNDLPVTHGTKAPMDPAVTGQAGASHARAVEALTRLAAKQTAGPLAIGPGQVLYVKSYSLTDGVDRYIHETWMDVKIGMALRVRRSDEWPRGVDITLSPSEIAYDTEFSANTPPGLHNLNGAYVAAFPTGGPGALAATWKQWAQQEYPGRGADGLIFERAQAVLHSVDPLLNAAQRGTLYLALLELPSVQATTATIAGTRYDVVCVSSQAQGTRCALFDPATGRYAGDALTGTDMVVKAGGFTFVDVGVQPRPAPGPERSPQGKKSATGSSTTPTR